MAASRTALRLAAGAAALIALWVIGAELPLLHWIALAAGRLQGAGLAGALLWGAGMYVATLLLVPIIPLILASGWLFGLWGIPVSLDRQSTRLNSSHPSISYAVFCLK